MFAPTVLRRLAREGAAAEPVVTEPFAEEGTPGESATGALLRRRCNKLVTHSCDDAASRVTRPAAPNPAEDHMTRIGGLAAALALLAFAGCGGGDGDSDAGDAEPVATAPAEESEQGQDDEADAQQEEKPKRTGSVVEVSESQFGTILTDADGRALYMFDKEQSERSECFGACAEAWPPFFSKGEPRAKGGVRQGLLGTTKHGNKEMVTYNGHPLYYYVDEGPNEVRCHNVSEFGGLWLVVGPNGDPRP